MKDRLWCVVAPANPSAHPNHISRSGIAAQPLVHINQKINIHSFLLLMISRLRH
jgi:hypothetical protein